MPVTACPKCESTAIEPVDVLDADDEPLGESAQCQNCYWLEEDEWPNVINA